MAGYKRKSTSYTKYKRKAPMAVTVVKGKKIRKPRVVADKVFDKTISFLCYNSFTTQGGPIPINLSSLCEWIGSGKVDIVL